MFLPGIFEIEMMQRVLMRKSNQAESFVIIALHSSIPRSSQVGGVGGPQWGLLSGGSSVGLSDEAFPAGF